MYPQVQKNVLFKKCYEGCASPLNFQKYGIRRAELNISFSIGAMIM